MYIRNFKKSLQSSGRFLQRSRNSINSHKLQVRYSLLHHKLICFSRWLAVNSKKHPAFISSGQSMLYTYSSHLFDGSPAWAVLLRHGITIFRQLLKWKPDDARPTNTIGFLSEVSCASKTPVLSLYLLGNGEGAKLTPNASLLLQCLAGLEHISGLACRWPRPIAVDRPEQDTIGDSELWAAYRFCHKLPGG